MLLNLGQEHKKHMKSQQYFWNTNTSHAWNRSKADAIVAAAHNLAKVHQGEMTTNIRETNTQQLKQLVEILQQTALRETSKWVEQKINTIPEIQGQLRVDETSQHPTQTQTNLPEKTTNDTQNKQN